jgi:hypothetical protein
MALYSRPDYYVKTFTARNCSQRSEFRTFRQLKQNVCPLRWRPCLPKSLISVWLDGRAGSALGARCPVFSCPVLSCRDVPVQPTPTGALEKVRFAIRMYTTREVRGMHGFTYCDLQAASAITLRSGARAGDSRWNGASRSVGGRVGWRGVNGPGACSGSFRARCVLTSGIGWVKGPQVGSGSFRAPCALTSGIGWAKALRLPSRF